MTAGLSNFFNAGYYLANNADVNAAINTGAIRTNLDIDGDGVAGTSADAALLHFNTYGWAEHRNPSVNFNVTYYLQNNPDVAAAGINPLTHFLLYGATEGRSPNATVISKANFDTAAYAAANSDLAGAGITTAAALYKHYLLFGEFENRPGTSSTATGQTITLTTGQDIVGPAGTTGVTQTTTNANETIRAVAGAAVGAQDQSTLNSSDIIDGSGGNDTLIVNLTGNYGGGATIKNVETLQLGTDVGTTAVPVTFDYNVNNGSYEITGVTTIVADQINSGEALTVNNIVGLNTSNPTTIPTLKWADEAGSAAGTFTANFRDSAVAGATTVNVVLSNVKALDSDLTTGRLNIGSGVETLQITSTGTTPNLLNPSTNNDGRAVDIVSGSNDGTADNGALTTVKVLSAGAGLDTALGQVGGVITDSTDANYGFTDRAAGSDLGIGGVAGVGGNTSGLQAVASNLTSLAATVTTFDASADTAFTAVRFTQKADNSATNVTFKAGSGGSYTEFELGNVSAVGGSGADTFAFITQAAGVTNSTFGAGDTITGGTGSDTLQIGVNGAGTYTLNTTEFSNVTGIDVLDLRGATNTVTPGAAFVAAADAGTFTIRTDRISQTSATNSANPTGATAANAAETASTSTIDLRQLNTNQAISVVGGSGSERLVVNNATFSQNLSVDAGTNGNVAGRYDTITIVNTGVYDNADLSNIKGIEGFVLAKNTTGANQFSFTLTDTFIVNNTAATNNAATSIDDTVFHISTTAAADGTAIGAGDTVTLDISGLLNAARTGLATTLTGRGIDVSSLVTATATVNYVVDGATATAAQIALVTKADANTADVTASAAGAVNTGGANLVASAAAFNTTTGANIVGGTTVTANNDTITSTIAQLSGSTVSGLGGTDTLILSDAGTVAINNGTTGGTLSSIETLQLANGTNVITFTAGSGILNVTGGTGADTITTTNLVAGGTISTGAGNDIVNLTADLAGTTINLGDGNDTLTSTVGGTVTATLNGGAGSNILNAANGDVYSGSVTNFSTLNVLTGGTVTFTSNSLLSQFSAITDTGVETIALTSGSHDISAATVTATGAYTFAISAGATLTFGGDAQIAAANAILTGAGNIVTNGSLTLAPASDTATGGTVTFGAAGLTITDTGGAVVRSYVGSSGADTLTIGSAAANTVAQTVNISQGGSDNIKLDRIGTDSGTVTITGFQAGATASGGDVLSLSYGAATSGLTTSALAAGLNITANGAAAVANIANVVALSNANEQIGGALTNAAAVTTAIVQEAATATTTHFYYVALDNGTDTGIYRFQFTDGDASGTINVGSEVGSLQLVATLVGISDVGALTSANFA